MNQTGICRVTGADLAGAGVALDQVAPDRIALSCAGEPVACRIVGAGGASFGEQSAVVFYGEALDTRYTDTNVYWLSWEDEPGPRMEALELGADTAQPADTFAATVHFEENKHFAMLYSEFLPRDDSLNPWFWMVARAGQPAELALRLPALGAGTEKVAIKTVIRGRTSSLEHDPDHHVRVSAGGMPLGEATFDGQAEALIEGEIDAAPFGAGDVTLQIEVVGDTAAGDRDQVYLDWVECTYARTFAAGDGSLAFQLGAGPSRRVTVEGLADGVAEVYRISDARAPEYATAGAVEAGRVSLSLGGEQPQSYLVTTPAAYLQPASVQAVRPSSLRATDEGADLIIIAHDGLVEAVQPLAEYRANQGLRVRTVPVSAVYDAFSDGIFTPHAIRRFLAYAYHEWRPPAPAFALLVGDASYDCRDYLGTGASRQVPTCEVRVAGSIPTASDHVFACVDGDDHVPELSIGRLPAATPEELQAVVTKIIAYESAPAGDWQKRALFVADHEGGDNRLSRYETVCEGLSNLAKERGLTGDLIRLRDVDPALPGNERTEQVRAELTPQVIEAFGKGTALIEFQGHGNERFWSRQKVLTLEDTSQLTAAPGLPICVDISCFTGWFDKPDLPGGHCLAEALLLAPEAGAVACIAPSRLGGLNLDAQLVPRLLAGEGKPLGEILRDARRSFIATQGSAAWDVVENYNLLGDPALKVRVASIPQVAEIKPPERRPPSSPPSPPPAEEPGNPPRLETAFALGQRPVDPSRPSGVIVLPGGRLNIQVVDPYVPGSLGRAGDQSLLFVARIARARKPTPPLTEAEPGRAEEGPRRQTNDGPPPAIEAPPALTEEDLAPLTAAGARVIRQVRSNAVILRLTPTQADQVAALPEVQWLGRLAPRLKVASALMAKALVFYGQSTVLVEHIGPDCLDDLSADLKEEGGRVVGNQEALPPNSVLVEVPSGLIAALANDERVVAVLMPPPAPEPSAEKEPEQ